MEQAICLWQQVINEHHNGNNMGNKIINLEENIINRNDQQKLQNFSGHSIAHGRATRWHWTHDDRNSAVLEIFRGGENEKLAVRIYRDRTHDVFNASDSQGQQISSGALDHIMAELEKYFMKLHGEE